MNNLEAQARELLAAEYPEGPAADILAGNESYEAARALRAIIQALASRDNALEEAAKVARDLLIPVRRQALGNPDQAWCDACLQIESDILALKSTPEPVATITRLLIPESNGEVERG